MHYQEYTFAMHLHIHTYIHTYIHILAIVKAPLRVLYDKIQHEGWGLVANTARGEAECCICHETPPRVLYFIVQHEYTVLLLICWFCVGGLLVLSSAIRCEELDSTLYDDIRLLLNAPRYMLLAKYSMTMN